MPQIEQKKWRAWFVLNRYSLRCSSPSMTRSPARGTDATTAPFLRQIEQSHRRGSSIPLGKASSSTTAPQWQEARCGLVILTPSISLITGTILLQHNTVLCGKFGAQREICPTAALCYAFLPRLSKLFWTWSGTNILFGVCSKKRIRNADEISLGRILTQGSSNSC